MSCSLKSSKDMLNEFGIITKFNEIVNIDALQTFEENLFESIGEDYVYENAMGNPFFIQHLGNKSKVEFNKEFFKILDRINNQHVFDSQSLEGEIVKPGIDFVFEQSPELLEIGSKEQYSRYLNTIFPSSKIKDIVYHGSNKTFDSFSKGDTYFSSNKDIAKGYQNKYDTKVNPSLKTVLINIENPYTVEGNNSEWFKINLNQSNETRSIGNIVKDGKESGYDGVLIKNIKDGLKTSDIISNINIVFNPEQIHVLGSEKDVKRFSDFIEEENKNTPELTQEQLHEAVKIEQREKYDDAFRRWYESENVGLNSPEAIDKNEILDQTRKSNSSGANQLEESIKKMNDVFDVKVILDKSIPLLGELLPVNHPISIQSGKPVILINPDLANQETVFHEFAHLYIDLLGGSKNQTINDAYQMLSGTDFHENVAKRYPELSGEMLNREVLAKAMGIQSDEIFGKELSDISAFNKIIDKIMEFMSNLFGIKKNAVYELSKELVTGDLQKTNIENYNSVISQKQKIDLDNPSHAESVKFIESILSKNKVITTETDRYYSVGQSGETQVVRESTTDFVSSKIQAYGYEYSSRRGDINKRFIDDDYNENNLILKLSEPKIPLSLDIALTNKLREAGFIKQGSGDNWESVIGSENYIDLQRRKNKIREQRESLAIDDLIEDDEDSEIGMASEYVLKHLNQIKNIANKIQDNFNRPQHVGNALHNAAEHFVHTGEILDNVEEKNTQFFDYLGKMLAERRADGSKFFTEVSVFDELNQLPGTIDLLEIDKNGHFIIHDYKTTSTFKSKYGDHQKSNEELFLYKGYIAQVMTYGRILENYGLMPAENSFHLIATEGKHTNPMSDIDSNEITIGGLKTLLFNKSERGQTGIKSAIFATDQKIDNQLRGRQLELKGVKDKTATKRYTDLISNVKDDLKIFNRLTAKSKRNIDSSKIKQLDKIFERIESNKDDSEKLKLRMSVDELINSIAGQMHVLENVISSGARDDFDKDYMYSLRYIIQASDNAIVLKKILDDDSENELGFPDKEATSADLASIISNIETSREYYKKQVMNHAAYELANNSNYMIGIYKERFNTQLRNSGIKNKADREARVEKMLSENKREIFNEEYKYWKQQYSEGILDLRAFEYFMADPGISKSQFVQVTKNILDKASIDKRIDLDAIVPKIVAWNSKVSYNKSGTTKEIWKDLLENREVVGVDGKVVKDLNGSVIPQYISDYREDMFKFTTQREHYYDLLREINNKKKKTPEDVANVAKITKLLEELNEAKIKSIEKGKKNTNYKTLRENPAYTSLSEEKKKDLQFIHKNLRDADERVFNGKLKLVNSFSDKETELSNEDIESGKGAFIYNLPRQRMSAVEAKNNLGETVKNAYSKIKDFVRQPTDAEEARYGEDGNLTGDAQATNDDAKSFNGAMSDIENNELFDTPVYYRNSLGADRALQSFDIPTLLAANHETTITYKAAKNVEADLFMISESLRLSDNISKTDSLISQKVKGAFNRPRKSDQNFISQAIKSQINNRLYGRHYSGVYSEGNYMMANSIGLLKNITSISTLSANYMSAINTTGSGNIYMMLESIAGEHFDQNDWKAGFSKSMKDMPNMLSDTQKYHPTSKTSLMIRMLGMDNHFKALTNKFVQKNFASKNLDEAALFSLTSMAETSVTAQLMYSLTNGIKMLNKKGEYIDKDGNVVEREKAMTFDESYEVVDGVLKLNPHVAYSSRDTVHKLQDSSGELNRIALARISGFTKSVYADMFGQYDGELKSVIEMTMLGGAAMSMKKWLPRGVNRRFRGITGLFETTKNLRDFDRMHSDENRESRFYSQDKMQFEEGYYTTAARYIRLVSHELRKTASIMAMVDKSKELKASMTDHEIANLKRAAGEAVTMIMLYAIKNMLLHLAESIGDDPRDRVKKERAYFAAYVTLKLYHEYNSFVNPVSLARTLTDPAVPAGQLFKIADLGSQLFGISYDRDSPFYVSPNILEVNASGEHKGEYKVEGKFKSTAIPGYRNVSTLSELLGINDDADYHLSDSYKFYAKNNK